MKRSIGIFCILLCSTSTAFVQEWLVTKQNAAVYTTPELKDLKATVEKNNLFQVLEVHATTATTHVLKVEAWISATDSVVSGYVAVMKSEHDRVFQTFSDYSSAHLFVLKQSAEYDKLSTLFDFLSDDFWDITELPNESFLPPIVMQFDKATFSYLVDPEGDFVIGYLITRLVSVDKKTYTYKIAFEPVTPEYWQSITILDQNTIRLDFMEREKYFTYVRRIK